jgi:hypothetical protein
MRKAAAFAICLLLPSLGLGADDTYEIAKRDAAAPVGTKATASVTITSKQGWHLNHDAPLTLKLSPTPGVALDKPKLGRSDLTRSTESEARFEVALTLTEPGRKLIEAEAGFVLCRQDSCRPIREKLTLTAEASAPQPAKKTPASSRAKKARKKS